MNFALTIGSTLQGFFASSGLKKLRVAILVRKGTPFKTLEVVQDEEGRFLLVVAMLDGRKITLVSIYAPNAKQDIFFAKLSKALSDHAEGEIILGGDFNAVINPLVDKTLPPTANDRTLTTLLREHSFIEIWRYCNSRGAKLHLLFGGARGGFSRLDMFFISDSLIPSVIDAEILQKLFQIMPQ